MLTIHDLPGPTRSASSDGTTMWCVAGDRILVFEASGAPRHTGPAPPGLGSIAHSRGAVVAAIEPGLIAWLDPVSGETTRQSPVGGTPMIVGDGAAAWVVDTGSGRAWLAVEPGVLGPPVAIGDVDQVAPEGSRLWWTSRGDTVLRSEDHEVDVGVGSPERGGLVACAGSVWLSVARGLVRVGTWAGVAGPIVPAPAGPVPLLACGDGVLVGGGGTEGLFVLDPSRDADVTPLKADAGGELLRLVVAGNCIWTFPLARAEARVIRLNPE